MSSTFGINLKLSIFGQSHSAGIGVVLDGLPAGLRLDHAALSAFMQRRAPGQSALTTARHETDEAEFLSGLVDNVTCGAPLCAVIRNHDTRSSDYRNLADVPRPSHADFSAARKFNGYQDVRGGGHFSGRLTAPLCLAGGICKQYLETKGITIGAHIASVGGIADLPFSETELTAKQLLDIAAQPFPVCSEEAGARMRAQILAAREAADSVGGCIECAAVGVPVGLGAPMFDGLENRIAAAVFAIPAIKGIEFGNGFACAALRGSENNDAFIMEDGQVRTKTNHHGGILGGISSGMPLIFRAAIKPTPSIGQVQDSVSLSNGTPAQLLIQGRHDPCIVPRAVPCLEAALALVLTDFLLSETV